MDFPLSRRSAPELIQLESVPSTNSALLALIAERPVVDGTALVTLDQTAGRGRLDRSWVAAPGDALAVSVFVRAVDAVGRPVPVDRLGWLPIAAGVAMTETVTELVPAASVGLKWPNDVLIGERKVSGVLAELLPDGSGAVIGAGLNLRQPEGGLPVPTATSLAIAGADPEDLVDRALARYLTRLRSHTSAFLTTGGRASSSGLRDRARHLCATLGLRVRVELPGASPIVGTAADIDDDGRLVVATADARHQVTVAAGDVVHLRHS